MATEKRRLTVVEKMTENEIKKRLSEIMGCIEKKVFVMSVP